MDYDVKFFDLFIYLFMDFNMYLKIKSGVVGLVFILRSCPQILSMLKHLGYNDIFKPHKSSIQRR